MKTTKPKKLTIELCDALNSITNICHVIEAELKQRATYANKAYIGIKPYNYQENDQYYRWIPKSPYELERIFSRLLDYIESFPILKEKHTKTSLKFLDIGCGLGQVVIAANLLRLNAYGLELREEYVITAQLFVREGKIMLGNALEYKKYKDYDILYAYCPIADTKLMQKLLDKITLQTTKDTLFIYYPANNAKLDKLFWEPVAKGEWGDYNLFIKK